MAEHPKADSAKNLDQLVARIEALRDEALGALGAAKDPAGAAQVHARFLGRKGSLKEILRGLGALDPAARARAGAAANGVQAALEEAFAHAAERFSAQASAAGQGAAPSFDVTLPGRPLALGSRHPVEQVVRHMIGIFENLGFSIADGPEIEDEWHDFTALNIPPEHIARDPSENFYLAGDDWLLRSQTSTVQIRVMEAQKPPLRVVAVGKVYRPDTVDATHSYMFHQIEGLMVDEGVSFRHLKSTLTLFFSQFFEREVSIRIRPSFFPFTEPSADVELSCPFCGAKGCKVCKRSGWIEMGGCGMVDPNVFEAVGYDPERYTGFAFGMGIERLAMTLFDIPDLRYLYENDLRFLEQFSF